MNIDADGIVRQVHSAFTGLPKNGKPRSNQWTTLAAVVMVDKGGHPTIASLATGMKCLSSQSIEKAKGRAVHDSHAEILAIRGFNRFLLQQTRAHDTPFLVQGTTGWRLCHGITLYLYASEAPCGDASMELTMAAQADATPWTLRDGTVPKGRSYFSRLGAVRCKPGRADSPSTTVMSCSDKLSIRQCTGLLLGSARALIEPGGTYLAGLILHQHNDVGYTRAWRGRMEELYSMAWAGYACTPFEIIYTSVPWAHCREPGRAPAPASILHIKSLDTEVLVYGVKQGAPKGEARYSTRFRSASCTAALEALLPPGSGPDKHTTCAVKADVKRVLQWPGM